MTADISDGFAERRAAVAAELETALAELPALRADREATRRAHEDAQHVWENFLLRLARGTRHGADEVTPAIAQMIAEQRRKRDTAAGAATLAQRRLGNLEWRIECRRAELLQLDLVANPPLPDRGPMTEIVKRPAPPGLGDFDPITWPPGSKPAEAA